MHGSEHDHLWINGQCAFCPASLWVPSAEPDTVISR